MFLSKVKSTLRPLAKNAAALRRAGREMGARKTVVARTRGKAADWYAGETWEYYPMWRCVVFKKATKIFLVVIEAKYFF